MTLALARVITIFTELEHVSYHRGCACSDVGLQFIFWNITASYQSAYSYLQNSSPNWRIYSKELHIIYYINSYISYRISLPKNIVVSYFFGASLRAFRACMLYIESVSIVSALLQTKLA